MHYRQAIYVTNLEAFSQVDMQKWSSQSFTQSGILESEYFIMKMWNNLVPFIMQ